MVQNYCFGTNVLSEVFFLSLRTPGQHLESTDSVIHKISFFHLHYCWLADLCP